MQKLEGKVYKILYRNERNYYTIMLLKNGSDTISAVGFFPMIYTQLQLTVFGTWKKHKKYGKQFDISSYEILEPTDLSELVEFLCSGAIRCTYLLALDISRQIGLDYLKKYKDVPFCLKLLKKEDENTKFILEQNKYLLDQFYERKSLLEELMKMDFSQELASKIAFSEIPVSINDVKANPYKLIKPFELDWNTVDRIALKNGIQKASITRIHEGICFLLDYATENHSHMFLPLEKLETTTKKFLGVEFDLKETLDELERKERIIRDTKKKIYSKENFEAEKRLAVNLFRVSLAKPKIEVKNIQISNKELEYSTEQKEAITLALKEQLAVISGAAGTGKTTIIKKIIEELIKTSHSIQLCAPTGRAAKRMKEVTGMKAKTIHHLLIVDPVTKLPYFNKTNPLPYDAYILDEASMPDIKIMSYLLEAIPDGAKLIIIGDVEQLPPVGPGRMFEDLLNCGFFKTKELTQIFRQANDSSIIKYATKVRNGEKLDVDNLPSKGQFKFLSTNHLNSMKKSIEKLITIFHSKKQYNIFDDLQIISPIHDGPIGVKELNSMVQDIVNSNGIEFTLGNLVLRQGDKVLQNRNNSDKNVFNGDIGKVVYINPKTKTVTVEFEEGKVDYIQEEIFQLELAYVVTVHKAQGGEYPFVILPFHYSFGKHMINRKLLYTAITRAKKQLIIIGDGEAINCAIETDKTAVRYCNLITRLKEAQLKSLFLKKAN